MKTRGRYNNAAKDRDILAFKKHNYEATAWYKCVRKSEQNGKKLEKNNVIDFRGCLYFLTKAMKYIKNECETVRSKLQNKFRSLCITRSHKIVEANPPIKKILDESL